MYTLTSYTDAAAFYRCAEPLWMRSEAAHCLSLGITTTLIDHPERFAATQRYMATVEDERGEVVVVALRTPPRDVILSQTDQPEALDALVTHLHAFYGTIPGVQAALEVGRQFAEKWSAVTKVSYELYLPERIFQIEQVQHPVGVPGFFRRAVAADKSVVTGWLVAFEEEAFGKTMTPPEQREFWFENGLYAEDRGIYLWEDESQPVSLVGHAGPTPNGMRIGPVYTPPGQRGHGYASACTAAVSQLLIDSGRKFCFLYTDLRNPTSNKIYQQIGYQPVIDCAVYLFT